MELQEFDISQGEIGVELTLLDLNNNKTDATIKVLSFHSTKGRQAFLDVVREAGENLDKNSVNLLAKLTVGWKNIKENGKEIPFSEDEAKRVYSKYPIIASQVERFVENAKNFIKK